MTHTDLIGNRIRPLANVTRLAILVKELEARAPGLPGMGVFYGPTGFGKSYAAAYSSVKLDCIHITIQRLWTTKTLLTQILSELSIRPRGSLADLMILANQGLATAGRTLIIDETDYAIQRKLIEIIRDLHDGSQVPVVLIGMETLPQDLTPYEVVDGRVMSWVGAEPAVLRDVQELAQVYAEGIDIDDPLMMRILTENNGSIRRISVDLAHVKNQATLQGVTSMTLDEWGDAKFLRGSAPAPRRDLA